jgi:hypothetical protein
MHQNIQTPETLLECGAKRIKAFAVLQIKRQQRRRSPQLTYLVVYVFERALRPRHQHQMRPQLRQFDRHSPPNPPASPCHQRDLSIQNTQVWSSQDIKVFWFFSSEKNFFFEKKKQKTFMSFSSFPRAS